MACMLPPCINVLDSHAASKRVKPAVTNASSDSDSGDEEFGTNARRRKKRRFNEQLHNEIRFSSRAGTKVMNYNVDDDGFSDELLEDDDSTAAYYPAETGETNG